MPGLALAGLQLDPAIAGAAVRAGNVAFSHLTNMRQADAVV